MKWGGLKPLQNKGFTLIELLAVIIILGILMIIAVPAISNYINNSRKSAYITTASNYIANVRNSVNSLEYKFTDTSVLYYVPLKCIGLEKGGSSPYGEFKEGYVGVTFNGTSYNYYFTSVDEAGMGIELTKEKDLDADKIFGGQSNINKNLIVDNVTQLIIIDDSTCNNTEDITYINGAVIYYNPVTGSVCNDYVVTNSNTGNKNGCMKWYAFNDTKGSTSLNLLLDHNTTATVRWSNTGSNNDNPYVGTANPLPMGAGMQGKAVWYQLEQDVAWWNNELKSTVRLIKNAEVVKITNATASASHCFDTGIINVSSPVCVPGNTTGCKYGWLYDRTAINCIEYGCLNNANFGGTMIGYWTSNSHSTLITHVYRISYRGLSASDEEYNYSGLFTSAVNSGVLGVRPVISVLKSTLN